MGINQCSKGMVLWKASGLTLKSLEAFGLGNRIDVDGNFLFHKISKMNAHKGKPIEMIVKEMALLLKTNSSQWRICCNCCNGWKGPS